MCTTESKTPTYAELDSEFRELQSQLALASGQTRIEILKAMATLADRIQ